MQRVEKDPRREFADYANSEKDPLQVVCRPWNDEKGPSQEVCTPWNDKKAPFFFTCSSCKPQKCTIPPPCKPCKPQKYTILTPCTPCKQQKSPLSKLLQTVQTRKKSSFRSFTLPANPKKYPLQAFPHSQTTKKTSLPSPSPSESRKDLMMAECFWCTGSRFLRFSPPPRPLKGQKTHFFSSALLARA